MSRSVRITVNGESFQAPIGEVLLDSALVRGVDLPHQCRSGRCGTCLVQVVSGRTIGGRGAREGLVHACQARVLTDVEISAPRSVATVQVDGELTALSPLGNEALEVALRLSAPLTLQEGQFVRVTFAGFPARDFSPTVDFDCAHDPHHLRFHIKIHREGRVSSALGRTIRKGHPVSIQGPFGSAGFQPRTAGRLVLFASGTGFAPIWSIANAALSEWSARPIMLIVGARSASAFYMTPALSRVAHYCPQAQIHCVVRERQSQHEWLSHGRPDDLAHLIAPGDIVHAAGSPRMVERIAEAAAAAGATMFADAFDAADDDGGFRRQLQRLTSWATNPSGRNRAGTSPSRFASLGAWRARNT